MHYTKEENFYFLSIHLVLFFIQLTRYSRPITRDVKTIVRYHSKNPGMRIRGVQKVIFSETVIFQL